MGNGVCSGVLAGELHRLPHKDHALYAGIGTEDIPIGPVKGLPGVGLVGMNVVADVAVGIHVQSVPGGTADHVVVLPLSPRCMLIPDEYQNGIKTMSGADGQILVREQIHSQTGVGHPGREGRLLADRALFKNGSHAQIHGILKAVNALGSTTVIGSGNVHTLVADGHGAGHVILKLCIQIYRNICPILHHTGSDAEGRAQIGTQILDRIGGHRALHTAANGHFVAKGQLLRAGRAVFPAVNTVMAPAAPSAKLVAVFLFHSVVSSQTCVGFVSIAHSVSFSGRVRALMARSRRRAADLSGCVSV